MGALNSSPASFTLTSGNSVTWQGWQFHFANDHIHSETHRLKEGVDMRDRARLGFEKEGSADLESS